MLRNNIPALQQAYLGLSKHIPQHDPFIASMSITNQNLPDDDNGEKESQKQELLLDSVAELLQGKNFRLQELKMNV